jgi:hypothetical protein
LAFRVTQDYAFHHPKAVLVDVTKTVPILHQTTSAGNNEGQTAARYYKDYNIELARDDDPKFADHGYSAAAQMVTEFVRGKVVVTTDRKRQREQEDKMRQERQHSVLAWLVKLLAANW